STCTDRGIKGFDRILVTEVPSGKNARAALMYLCTQAKLTGSRTINVSESYRSFTEAVGLDWQGVQRGKEALRQLMLVSAATFTSLNKVWMKLLAKSTTPILVPGLATPWTCGLLGAVPS